MKQTVQFTVIERWVASFSEPEVDFGGEHAHCAGFDAVYALLSTDGVIMTLHAGEVSTTSSPVTPADAPAVVEQHRFASVAFVLPPAATPLSIGEILAQFARNAGLDLAAGCAVNPWAEAGRRACERGELHPVWELPSIAIPAVAESAIWQVIEQLTDTAEGQTLALALAPDLAYAYYVAQERTFDVVQHNRTIHDGNRRSLAAARQALAA